MKRIGTITRHAQNQSDTRYNSLMQPLIEIENASFARPGNLPAFRDLSWTWREGETWAVTGPVAAGKSTFLDVLLGQLRRTQGDVRWPITQRLGRPVAWPNEIMERVSFKEDSRLFSYADHYYQQRYDFSGDAPTLEEFLRTGRQATPERFGAVCELFHLNELLPRTLLQLSNGQTRRARLARALLAEPVILLLDEPLVGLDEETRPELDTILKRLVEQGQKVVIATKPDAVPEWVTHVLHLEGMKVTAAATRSETKIHHRLTSKAPQAAEGDSNAEPVIECENVRVTYGGKPVLQGIDWTVRRGERWALLGPNGSGKTTLLSLLCGDHPQAFSNVVKLFGQQRGSGETIWDVKRRVGFVSPELHLYFSEPLLGYEAAATGFHDVLVHRTITPEQAKRLDGLFDHFDLAALKERPFRRMSSGEQRQILLLRALTKDPELLVLDEPFQGLDAERIAKLKDWLDNRLHADRTLIFVTHYEGELPTCVTRVLRLKDGRVVT